jgi:type 1 fimbria pilin
MGKRIVTLVLLALIALLTIFNVFADGTGTWSVEPGVGSYTKALYPGEIKNFTCTVDSLDTLWSNEFTLGKYNGVHWGVVQDTLTSDTLNGYWNSNRQPFKIRAQISSTLGNPKVSAWVEGNFVGDSTSTAWVVVDTLFVDRTAETLLYLDVDLNNQKYPYYRVKVQGVALNRSDTVFDLKWHCYQNDGN